MADGDEMANGMANPKTTSVQSAAKANPRTEAHSSQGKRQSLLIQPRDLLDEFTRQGMRWR